MSVKVEKEEPTFSYRTLAPILLANHHHNINDTGVVALKNEECGGDDNCNTQRGVISENQGSAVKEENGPVVASLNNNNNNNNNNKVDPIPLLTKPMSERKLKKTLRGTQYFKNKTTERRRSAALAAPLLLEAAEVARLEEEGGAGSIPKEEQQQQQR